MTYTLEFGRSGLVNTLSLSTVHKSRGYNIYIYRGVTIYMYVYIYIFFILFFLVGGGPAETLVHSGKISLLC